MNTVKEMRIETERLLIKPYQEEDLEECFKLVQNKELFTYLDMDVMSHEDYKGLFRWLIDSYEAGFDEDFKYSFNITLTESGTHIGWCGIGGVDENMGLKLRYMVKGLPEEFDFYNGELFYSLTKEEYLQKI
jgi:[ribosomal protein S5]-alanine N-acetyltransferase